MSDSLPNTPGTNPPRHIQEEPPSAGLIAAVFVAFMLVLGLTVWVTELSEYNGPGAAPSATAQVR